MERDFKLLTIRSYDNHAEDYEKRTAAFIEKMFKEEIKSFIEAVKSTGGLRVLDIGSGPGRDGLYFKKAGLEPVCIDLSKEMVKRCKEKGLEAYVMDFYNFNFPDESFAGIWALFSLLHVPKKNLPRILEGIRRIIRKDGIFYIAMSGGKGEGLRGKDRYEESRYFAYWEAGELKSILKKYFLVRRERVIKNPEKPGHPILCFECRKLCF